MALRNFVPKINKENRTIGTLLKKWLKGFFYDLHIEHNLTDETNNVSVAELKTSVNNSHTHSNKALLDSYTQTNSDLQDAVLKKHEHSNKTLLDTYTQTESNLADAVNKKHSHNNQAILDATQESFTTALKSSYDTHVSNTNNPHNTTAAQVGLGNVTNDAQLKRASGDFNTFTEKTTIVDNDITLIEDSENSFAKKKGKISTIKNKLQTDFDLRYAQMQNFNAGDVGGYLLDGVDDYVQVNDNTNLNFGTNNFSMEFVINLSDYTPSAEKLLAEKNASNIGWKLLLTTDGRLKFQIGNGTNFTTYSYTSSVMNVVDGKTIMVGLSASRTGNLTYYVNGVQLSTSDISGASAQTLSSTGALNIFGNGSSYTAWRVLLKRFYNRLLSASEFLEHYNNGNPLGYVLPYADRRASQTVLTSGTLTIGKKYRIDTYVTGDDFTNVGASSNASGVEFTATGTTPTTWTNASSLRQVGCVAEYLPQNAGAMGWLESQNGLHGITSGNPIAISGYRDYKSGISTTAVQFVNTQKAFHNLKQIIVKNNYAGTNTIYLGTTTNANEIINGVSINNGETKVIDVNSYSATTRSLYVKAGYSNIDVTFIYEKIN